MSKKLKNSIVFILAIALFAIIFCRLSYQSVYAFSGVPNTLSEKDLYNATNTYDVNEGCFYSNGEIIKNNVLVPVNSKKNRYNPEQYNITYNMSQKNSNQVMNSAQITVLTHGLGSDAGAWSNHYSSTNHGDGSDYFAYDSQSLISKISEKVGGANIYWAKNYYVVKGNNYEYDGFNLYDISNQKSLSGDYTTTDVVSYINDISKHIIIVFEAEYPLNSNANIYYQFNYTLSKIIYDVKISNGGILPKVNLVGHSRGGLTNLQYALDHPDLVSTLVSLGTPYFGSTTANLFGEIFMEGPSEGLDDILNPDIYYNYNARWNSNYNTLYKDIDVYAIGSYHTLMSLVEVIDNDYSGLLPNWSKPLISAGLGLVNGVKLVTGRFYPTEQIIAGLITEMFDCLFPADVVVDAAEIVTQELNYDIYPPFVSWYSDILVPLESQLGNDSGSVSHANSGSYIGFNSIIRPFLFGDDFVDYERVSQAMPPVGHNLEARDKIIIAEILDVLDLGVNKESAYVTAENEDGTLTFLRYSGKYQNPIFNIPESINGINVTAINSFAFAGQNSIVEIQIPKSVKKIGSYAFAGLNNLTTITFSGRESIALEEVGYGAFAGCSSLNKFNNSNAGYLSLPASVTIVNNFAFYGTAFSNVNIGANVNYIGEGAFSNIQNLTKITVATGNSHYVALNNILYDEHGSLIQYPIGNTATSFSIPTTVSNFAIRHISRYAFLGENDLTSLDLNNIISIDAYAFTGCTSLETLSNASNVEFIGLFAFDDTPLMNQDQDFITIGKVLYRYKGKASVLNTSDFPVGITRISANAFSCNDVLTEIQLPLSIIDIDNCAFVDCQNLNKIISTNGTLPDVGEFTFVGLNASFKFYCRKSLIDNLSPQSNWYGQSDILVPIATQVYFEDLNTYETFYYGDTVTLPTEEIKGKYNKGWLRVNESDNQTYGGYLTPSTWNETVATATYRADLLILNAYTIYVYNGDTQVGAFNISTGDYYQLNKTGYTINGLSYTYANSSAMSNCYYNGYYGPSVVNGTTIADFNGWLLFNNEISEGQWLENYSDNALYIYADWNVVEFTATVYNGYSNNYSIYAFNYCDGLNLSDPVRSGYKFKGWKNNNTNTIVSIPLRTTTNVSLTAQWVQIYSINYKNLTFQGQTADVLLDNNICNYAPTEYEYGVGLDLSRVSAFWQSKSSYSRQLRFLGWYSDQALTIPATSISKTATGTKTFYAKWRFDFNSPSRYGEHRITDADPYTNEYYDEIWHGLKYNNLYADLKSIGINYIAIEFKINIKEVNDGYQEIMIYDGLSSTSNLLWSVKNIEHGPGYKETNFKWYIWTVEIEIDKIKDSDALYVRYGAHGRKDDDWINDKISMHIMYTVEKGDCSDSVLEFYWSYKDDVKDSDCIPLEDVSEL